MWLLTPFPVLQPASPVHARYYTVRPAFLSLCILIQLRAELQKVVECRFPEFSQLDELQESPLS